MPEKRPEWMRAVDAMILRRLSRHEFLRMDVVLDTLPFYATLPKNREHLRESMRRLRDYGMMTLKDDDSPITGGLMMYITPGGRSAVETYDREGHYEYESKKN